MEKTGKSKETNDKYKKGKQVVREGNSSSSLLMGNKRKQVQVFVDHHSLPESSSSSSSAPIPLPQLPPGFRFAPKEPELIIDYLHKKVMGNPINYDPTPVVERELYGNEEPSQICRALGKAEHEDFYVFTQLRSKSGGTHMARQAGNGTWKGDHKPKPVYDENDMTTLIGYRTTLTFFHNMTKRTSWIMHQYTLPHQQQGWALCRIHNEDQAKKKRKFSAITCAPQHPIPIPSVSPQPIINDSLAPQHPIVITSPPPPPQPLLQDSPVHSHAEKRPRINDHTPSSSSQPTQTLPSNDCDTTGLLSFLLNDVDYYEDMDPLLEFSQITASQNVYDDLASVLSPAASTDHITPSELSATLLASSSSSYPAQDLCSSSQTQRPTTFPCNNTDWSPWLIDENAVPF